MTGKYKKRERYQLTQDLEDYTISLTFGENDESSLLILEHQKKHIYFENFRSQKDLFAYLAQNNNKIGGIFEVTEDNEMSEDDFKSTCKKLSKLLPKAKLSYYRNATQYGPEIEIYDYSDYKLGD